MSTTSGMLERATACLKSGAFREPLRCAQGVQRSKRLLHSTFWSHGAGDLDLPHWVAATGVMPPDLPFQDGDKRGSGGNKGRKTVPDVNPATERMFLDFLLPPQTIAWLKRKQAQPLRTWEKRNMRRLPSGYVVASRRYASHSYRPFGVEERDTTRKDEGAVKKSRKSTAFRTTDPATPNEAEGTAPTPSYVPFQLAPSEPPDIPKKRGSLRRGASQERGEGDVDISDLGSDIQAWGMSKQYDDVDDAGSNKHRTRGAPQTSAFSEPVFSDSPGDIAESEIQRTNTRSRDHGLDTESPESQTDFSSEQTFGDSPADLAEIKGDPLQVLRNILASYRDQEILRTPQGSLSLTARAWAIYKSLDREARMDVRLKQELLVWLSCREDKVATVHCTELYDSIPKSSRTFEVYKAALASFTCRGEQDLMLKLHKDALDSLENGYLISRILFRHAVDEQMWQLAIDTALQHSATYSGTDQLSHIRVFWLHVSELPELFIKAIQLASHFGGIEGLRSDQAPQRDFCFRFFKEAVSQEFLQVDESPRAFPKTWQVPPRRIIRAMFQHIIDLDPDPTSFMQEVMFAAFRDNPKLDYSKYHHVFSYIYRQYCTSLEAVPSEDLLFAFLRQLGRYWTTLRDEYRSHRSVNIETLTNDWKRYHGKVSSQAVNLLLSQYARHGEAKKFEQMLEYQQSEHPEYKDQRDSLWTMIYLHARRADLDMAQQAFSEVQRITGEHGEKPSLQCWNVLLHAHMRVDDLEGALTNFQNIIDYAKLRPDSYSFSPLWLMLAKRGDVEGVENLFEQYDRMVGKRRTSDMMLSLMVAHFKNDDNAQAAEKVLQDIVTMSNEGELVGALTPCFNALMGFYATRRDVDATMRVYRWMRKEKVWLDGETFGSLIQALLQYRRAGEAYKVLRDIMPEYKVKATAYHYALLMAGYTRQRMFAQALALHDKMTNANIKPTLGTHVNYLKAKAAVERERRSSTTKPADESEDPVPLEDTLKELQYLMSLHDAKDIASSNTMTVTDKLDLDDPLAPYFDFLIYIHGERRCFEAAKVLFEQYKELSRKGQRGDTIPIRMLSSLMSVHWHANEHDKVEEYWQLARQQADEIARAVHIPQFAIKTDEGDDGIDPLELAPLEEDVSQDTNTSAAQEETAQRPVASSEAKQTLLPSNKSYRPQLFPARRHILDRPLQWYIRALSSQARIGDAISVVSQLLSQGYTLGKRTWNLFICSLLDSRPPLALLAFVLTERFLIPHFPGWATDNQWPPRPANRFNRIARMQARYINRQQLMPEYQTLVRLGAAMLDVRKVESRDQRREDDELPGELRRFVGTIRDIRSRASKTVYVVQSMPAVPDGTQAKWLGGAGR